MNELPREALAALRDCAWADATDGEATRQRIQATLLAQGKRRVRRRSWAVPLAACCMLSTALAFYATRTEETSPRGARVQPGPPRREVARAAPRVVAQGDDPPAQESGPAMPSETTISSVDGTSKVPEAKHKRARHQSRAPAPSVAPAKLEISAVEREALYMTAHRLQFRGTPQAALAAWNAYLASEPSGPLAIEARYNRAVVLVRLGQDQAAREALSPFAEGVYGDFRRVDAVLLLRQLR